MRPFVKEVLVKTYLFQDLTPEQTDFIAAMLEKETLFRKDQYIIHEGDQDNSLFLIETGSVRLVRVDEQGQPRELMTLGVGEIFGELSLITGLPRTASVIANEDSIILELKKESFDRLTKQYQNLKVKLALLVEQRLRQSQQIKAELQTPRGVKRVAKSSYV
jgi:CRP-like cAMP-binding protein